MCRHLCGLLSRVLATSVEGRGLKSLVGSNSKTEKWAPAASLV